MVSVCQYHRSQGFTFIGILIIVALSGLALGIVGQVWHHANQREKEKELLFVGEQYRLALTSYFENTPGGAKEYPRTLDELLLDKRFPVVRRHIRQLYPDPMQPSQPWVLIKQQDFIIGLHSASVQAPIKKTGFPERYANFAEAQSYADWKFVANN
jgi:type II secretory pathway pseudopilin PulG